MVLDRCRSKTSLSMSIDWTEIYTNYKGRWVALEDDEQTVVGSGKVHAKPSIKHEKTGAQSPS